MGIRAFSLWLSCGLFLWLSGPLSAQWLFDKKPDVKDSAMEVSRQIPGTAKVVVGFDLQGQIDILGMVGDVKASLEKSSANRNDVREMEAELGFTFEDWIDLFTGAGYLALLAPEPGKNLSDEWIFALRLKRPEAFSTWLQSQFKDGAKKRTMGAFTIWEVSEGIQFGAGKGWFFICSDRTSLAHQLSTLSQKERDLFVDATFQNALSSLTGGDSGLFIYADGPAVQKAALELAEVPLDHPMAENLGFWDFAILSVDFKEGQSDAFLAYSQGSGRTLQALRAPGGVNQDLLDLVPAGQSTYSVADARWMGDVVTAFGRDVPDIGFLLILAQSQLNRFGDLSEAFVGTVVVATNGMEYLAKTLFVLAAPDTKDEDSPLEDLSEPSIFVAMPVKDVEAAHDLMLNATEATTGSEVDGSLPDTRSSVPGVGETQRYEVADGPKAVLNHDKALLTLAYGPHAETLLGAPSGHVAGDVSVQKALQWGDGRVVYLDYLDLEPVYQSALRAAEQTVEGGGDGASVYLDILREMRSRLGKLEGVSALKTTSTGLHYRATGFGNSQMLAAFGLGGAILVPNFTRARAQGQLTACESNLKNIGTACEMWSTDHDGEYPASLEQLTPDYLRSIPVCPAAGIDTYSASYRLVSPEESGTPHVDYEFYCQGHSHEEDGLPADFPKYNGVEGLIAEPR